MVFDVAGLLGWDPTCDQAINALAEPQVAGAQWISALAVRVFLLEPARMLMVVLFSLDREERLSFLRVSMSPSRGPRVGFIDPIRKYLSNWRTFKQTDTRGDLSSLGLQAGVFS